MGTAQAAPSAASSLTAPLTQNANQNVIVIFKSQPAQQHVGSHAEAVRASSITAYQKPLVTGLHTVHATHLKQLQAINSLSATVSSGEEARLKANPDAAEVIPDVTIQASFGLDTQPDTREWVVPTEASSISFAQSSTVPAMFDYGPFPGDPDLPSTSTTPGQPCSTSEQATYAPAGGTVTAGFWFAQPSECGPYTTTAMPGRPPSPRPSQRRRSTRPSRRTPATCGWPSTSVQSSSRPARRSRSA